MTDKTKGFTLLEVLLAVLILGVSLAVFLEAAAKGVRFVSNAKAYETSRTFLNRLELEEPMDLENLEEGAERGTLDGGRVGPVEWTRQITVEGKEEDQLFRIRTEVTWGDNGIHRESKETLLYQPDAVRGGWVQEPAD